ncbi:ABC transporter ATP-binding protein [Thermosynechococcaceae cyanobacterium Okahandja]
MREAAFLALDGVSRSFGGLKAVDRVSLRVEEGEIFGIIGPNGAGKTTLFNLLTGLIPLSSGEIYFRQQRLSQAKPHQIAALGIGRTFQNIRLFKEMTVWQNVRLGQHRHEVSQFWAHLLHTPLVRQQQQRLGDRARELLYWLDLYDRRHELAGHLSYGEQRRLEIARALALQPSLLLLDEPAAGMNPAEKQGLCELIRRLHEAFALTIILIEHHVPLVMNLCDRIAVLDFGQLIALGDPLTVKNDPKVIEAYLGGDV